MPNYVYKRKNISDLIEASQNSDIKALEELIKRVQKDVYSIFFHLCKKKNDVSDLTQEVLIKMAKSISTLKSTKNFKSWLNQIITNVFYDYTRKTPNINFDYNEKELNEIKDKIGCEPGEKCLFSEIEKFIKIAIISLPYDLRITLLLREYEGLSYYDISKITNTNIGTVKSRLSRAREKIQFALKDFI